MHIHVYMSLHFQYNVHKGSSTNISPFLYLFISKVVFFSRMNSNLSFSLKIFLNLIISLFKASNILKFLKIEAVIPEQFRNNWLSVDSRLEFMQIGASLVAQMVKNLPAMWKTRFLILQIVWWGVQRHCESIYWQPANETRGGR